VAARRESSTVVAGLIGWLILKESLSMRVAASAAIAFGAALLALAGAS
jgi:drug/metabolite transporter (DMT)-like permease